MKNISKKGIDLLKISEGCVLYSYPDPASKLGSLCTSKNIRVTAYKKINDWQKYDGSPWTIGYGTTILPNGAKVPKDSYCTKEEAEIFLKHDLEVFEIGVNKFVTVPINQNQFDALVCFAYNVGLGALKSSSLLKKININPNDETIKDSFLAYSKSNGEHNKKDDDKDGLIDEKGELQILQGLETRRKNESKLYFS